VEKMKEKNITKNGKVMGRPKIEIKAEQFEYLCSIMCTEEEIAGVFRCSIDTINNWCKSNYDMTFSEIYKMFSASGKMSLRRYQFKMAERNPSMAIWLGKQYLGQTEKQEMSVNYIEDDSTKAMTEYFEKMKKEKKGG
jgi:hypothetical protein